MAPEYTIERFDSRTWYGAKRYGWRVVAKNGEIILSSNQAHTRRIDRDTTANRFYERACVPGVVELR